MNRTFIALGAWMAMLGVGLGAFGTHGLKSRISEGNLEIWKTGVQYHVLHAIALVLVGVVMGQMDRRILRNSGWLFFTGILIFGGSLYALAVTDTRWLGAITPLGGLCFLAGWACLAIGASQKSA